MASIFDRLWAGLRKGQVWVAAMFALGIVAVGLVIWLTQFDRLAASPETVVRRYMTSVYAQDYNRAYEFISTRDKAYKSREQYLRENHNGFSGFTLEAARQLAAYIELPEVQTDIQGDRASVTLKFIVPDGNDPAVRDILFAAPEGDGFSAAERRTLLTRLDQLHQSGQIPTFEGEQTFELVKEADGWYIFEEWTDAVRVHFSGQVMDGLSWEFESSQEVVLAKPGETLQTIYRAKNLSDQTIVAKARHVDQPEEYLDFLNIIQCFCFIQQTLEPGEEAELPLVFRVDWDVPVEVKDFYVHYEFYPIESFPEDSQVPISQQ